MLARDIAKIGTSPATAKGAVTLSGAQIGALMDRLEKELPGSTCPSPEMAEAKD
jgi:hypothetical protein